MAPPYAPDQNSSTPNFPLRTTSLAASAQTKSMMDDYSTETLNIQELGLEFDKLHMQLLQDCESRRLRSQSQRPALQMQQSTPFQLQQIPMTPNRPRAVTAPLQQYDEDSGMNGVSLRTNMYAVDQFYADQQNQFIIAQQQQQHQYYAPYSPPPTPRTSSPMSDGYSVRRPSMDTQSSQLSRMDSPPQLTSRSSQSSSSSSQQYIQNIQHQQNQYLLQLQQQSLSLAASNRAATAQPVSTATRSGFKENLPKLSIPTSKVNGSEVPPTSATTSAATRHCYYPSNMASLSVLLTSSLVLHGSIQRSDSIINSTNSSFGTSPSPVPASPSAFSPTKKKSLFNLFKKKKATTTFCDGGKSGWISGPLSSSSSALEAMDFVGSSLNGNSGNGRSRGGSVSSVGSGRGGPKSDTGYSAVMMETRPRMVFELKNACVAEDGIWVLKLSGLDLTRSGVPCDFYLQAVDCDEMVRWLKVLKGASQL
ncbi:hypothetical protein BDR26DRAFT_853833 [Obelidium mucronatum]|nr:hypothetical protein BDR26DRAFT_853833 [Obelidium mucronatum]